MNLDSLSFALSEISFAVANFTKKNYKSSVAEINRLVALHGEEAEKHLYRCLLSHVDISGDGKSSGKDFHQTQLVAQELPSLISKPSSVTILCHAIENPLHHQKGLKPTPNLLPQISKLFRLTRAQEVIVGVILTSASGQELRNVAKIFVRQRLPELLTTYLERDSVSSKESGLQDVSIEALHFLLSGLCDPTNPFEISNEQKRAFLQALQKDFPRIRVPVVLTPLLYPEKASFGFESLNPTSVVLPNHVMEMALPGVIQDAGYGCTSDKDRCRQTLIQVGGVREITSQSIARVLGMMARTPSNLEEGIQVQTLNMPTNVWNSKDLVEPGVTTWNVDVFVQVVQELTPSLNWRDVVKHMDHPGFYVANRAGLVLLTRALKRALHDNFPVDDLYRMWSNTEGQMSWLASALKNPDVISLSDFTNHNVALDILKSPPDEDSREVAVWKCLDLVEVLLLLSESGHYQQVSELFKYPLQHCPDVLVLTLLQVCPSWNTLKRELLSSLIPLFLASHPNSASVLHYAWHCQGQLQNIRTLVMQSMAEWYLRGNSSDPNDQMRLSRILDVAQDLKALHLLLNASPFIFVVDLACLASRREYLKLDKWLTDKIRDHGEPFIQATVGFLKRRCPQLLGAPLPPKDEPPVKGQQLSPETIATILACLQPCIGSMTSSELLQDIYTMMSHAGQLLSKTRQQQMAPPMPLPPAAAAALLKQQQPPQPQQLQQASNLKMDFPGMGGLAGINPNMAPPLGMPGSPGKFGSNVVATQLSAPSPFQMVMHSVPTQQLSGLPVTPGSAASMSGSVMQPPQPPSAGPMGRPQPTSQSSLATPGGTPAPMSVRQQQPVGQAAARTPAEMSIPEMAGQYSKEVEDEANTYFQKIYNQPPVPTLSIEEVLDMLKKFKDSTVKREREVFSCMLRNLFEEYKFFPQYPDRELHVTALLFGGIIDQGLVQYMALGLALRYVLEALRKPVGNKMYTFGLTALDRFKGRLKEYWQYCQHLISIPHFSQFPSHLIAYVEHGARQQEPPGGAQAPAVATASAVPVAATVPPQQQQTSATALVPQQPPQPATAGLSAPVTSEPAALQQQQPSQLQPQGSGQQPVVPAAAVGGVPAASAPATSTGPALPHAASMPTLAATAVSSIPMAVSAAVTAASASIGAIGSAGKSVKPSIANTTNIDTLLAGNDNREEIIVPPESLQDKVFFIFNNLSQLNMQQKADELCEGVREEYLPWVAQYLVMKRASIEPNFHSLYVAFLDVLRNVLLLRLTLKETFRNIKVLLRIDKVVSNFSDRSLLKNLGHWLGLLTLANSKPIKYTDLDLKSLLYEAYHKGAQELLYVVPFVAKVLESAVKSRIFRPPSPYTMGIMRVLAELHEEQDLKLNLKFEIEVLCKTLGLEVSELPAVHYLKDESRLQTIDHQLTAQAKQPVREQSQMSMLPQDLDTVPVGSTLQDAGMVLQSAGMPSGVSSGVTVGPPNIGQFPSVAVSAGVGSTSTGASLLSSNNTASSAFGNTSVTVVSSGSSGAPATTAHQPQFGFNDANLCSLASLAVYILTSDQIPLLQTHPHLKQYVKPMFDKAVSDLQLPVIERAVKIALNTTEQIIKKDFALDPEEARMRAAAHHMVRHMTAGMTLITCREPLVLSMRNHLTTAFATAVRAAVPQPSKESIEQGAQMLAQDNVDLACAYLQKMAVEKAIPELDKRLSHEFELRQQARQEGRRYCDPVSVAYHNEHMPDALRLRVGGSASVQQLAVYDEFARQIPGFLAGGDVVDQMQLFGPRSTGQVHGPEEAASIFDRLTREVDAALHRHQQSQQSGLSAHLDLLHSLQDAILGARTSKDVLSAGALLLHHVIDGFLKGCSVSVADTDLATSFRDCHLFILKELQDQRAFGPQWTNKQITRYIVDCREDYKYNVDAVAALIRSGLFNLQLYDQALAASMENGLNYSAVAFAMQLVQRLILDERGMGQSSTTSTSGTVYVSEADFYNTIENLARLSTMQRQAPEGLPSLVDAIRQQNDGGLFASGGATGGPVTSMQMQSGISQASREFDDPPGLHEKTEYLLREWVSMYHSPLSGRDSSKAFPAFVSQMHQQGILKTDDLVTRFFRLCTEMCADICYRALAEQSSAHSSPSLVRAKCFHTLDAYVRLITLLVKHSGEPGSTVTKVNLLNKVCGIVAGVLLQDHDARQTEFQQLPYHRIFIMLFIELNAADQMLESINFQVLTAFCHTYHAVRPAKAPGFAYAWLELISHRVFIGRMLSLTPQQKAWGMYAHLLSNLFKFLAPFLRNAELTKPMQTLYKGTLRVLLVLLHDFPEFLCDYHYVFCDNIPPNCIQMRNLILSAFPRNMRLPDPFTPNLKVDMLAEIGNPPRIMANFAATIQPSSFKRDLDSYLKTRTPFNLLTELRSNLQANAEPGSRYNIPLINAVVLYVGTQAIQHVQSKMQTPTITTVGHTPYMDIFQNLAVDLDTEGRYLFLNALANQLRYPNSHTHYFSCALLHLFAEVNKEAVQEQITRVLLERLIVNRPHPWGLLITFIELIKNPVYKFWAHDFVHCAPEISRLFESVARSCSQPRQGMPPSSGPVSSHQQDQMEIH